MGQVLVALLGTPEVRHAGRSVALPRLELGVAPAPETEALGQRARTLVPVAPAAAAEERFSEPGPVLQHAPFVGRAVEFAQLVDAYYVARAGRPQALVLRGEAGVGKTRLATEFLAWASAPVRGGGPSRSSTRSRFAWTGCAVP